MKDAVRRVAEDTGLPRNDLYNAALAERWNSPLDKGKSLSRGPPRLPPGGPGGLTLPVQSDNIDVSRFARGTTMSERMTAKKTPGPGMRSRIRAPPWTCLTGRALKTSPWRRSPRPPMLRGQHLSLFQKQGRGWPFR